MSLLNMFAETVRRDSLALKRWAWRVKVKERGEVDPSDPSSVVFNHSHPAPPRLHLGPTQLRTAAARSSAAAGVLEHRLASERITELLRTAT